MGWFIQFVESSIGKKVVMATTGFFLIIYLIIHLAGNLLLYAGDGGETFNKYGEILRSLPIIKLIEIVLALAFLFHIINGVRLWWLNKKAKPLNYAKNNQSRESDIFSRTMIHSGVIVFIFLVIHLRSFFIPAAFTGHPGKTMFDLVIEAFSDPLYSGFYVLAMILLGFHLNHGFQSAFQTFGWNHTKYFPLVKFLGTLYAIIMAVGFGSMPIYFLFFYGGS